MRWTAWHRLRAAGKRTLLLTNAPRPNAPLQQAMRGMGIADALYTGVLTSGEAVRDALRDPPDRWWATLGPRVFHLGPERDRGVLEGLAYTRVATPAEASFVLNTGPDDLRDPTSLDEFDAELRDCLRHRLPMVCANPDLEVICGGRLILCAGALALRYQALGGDMRMLGKPDPAIYDRFCSAWAMPADRVLAVGDALRTDIAGAAGVGIESLLGARRHPRQRAGRRRRRVRPGSCRSGGGRSGAGTVRDAAAVRLGTVEGLNEPQPLAGGGKPHCDEGGGMSDLYDRDFYAWTAEQAALLRAGKLSGADIPHIAEEIESMGRSEKRELVSRLTILLQHLLKWQFQPDRRSTPWPAVDRQYARPACRAPRRQSQPAGEVARGDGLRLSLRMSLRGDRDRLSGGYLPGRMPVDIRSGDARRAVMATPARR